VLVQEHVPKVRDFFAKDCWAHHPKPYADYVEFKVGWCCPTCATLCCDVVPWRAVPFVLCCAAPLPVVVVEVVVGVVGVVRTQICLLAPCSLSL
jgi:hypothetical protein